MSRAALVAVIAVVVAIAATLVYTFTGAQSTGGSRQDPHYGHNHP